MLEGNIDAAKAEGCGYGGEVWVDVIQLVREAGGRAGGGSGKL